MLSDFSTVDIPASVYYSPSMSSYFASDVRRAFTALLPGAVVKKPQNQKH